MTATVSVLGLLLGCGQPLPDGGSAPAGRTPTGAPVPVLDAVAGSQGTVVWIDAAPDPTRLHVAVRAGAGWDEICTGEIRCWTGQNATAVRAWDDYSGWSSVLRFPAGVPLSLDPDRSDASWWVDEAPTLDVSARLAGTSTSLYLSRVQDGATTWWDVDAGTWRPTPVPYLGALDGPLTLPAGALPPGQADLQLVAGVADTGWATDGSHHPLGMLPVEQASVPVVSLGRQYLWGDLHAHTDLSHDGCSDPDDGCVAGGASPAAGAFDGAIEDGLDFAAITDHAEWMTWQDVDGLYTVDIWDRGQELVAAAEAAAEADGSGFIPLLGYEWTNGSSHALPADEGGYWPGGHRNVVFEDLAVCADARIAGSPSPDTRTYTKAEAGSLMTGGNDLYATTKSNLLHQVDTAMTACDLSGRVLMVPHHPAWSPPSPVDWTNPDNVPDPDHEPLVEMYSEHGASECLDWSADYCTWREKAESDYIPAGSLQSALMEGMRFGVAGSTDSHDGKPGTVTNDPSCTAIWDPDLGEVRCHGWRGGLTGVLVEGSPGRSTLFDGIFDRTTIATSGPRYPVRAFVLLSDGGVALPGQDVDASLATRLVVSVEDLVDAVAYDTVEIDLIDADGTILDQSDSGVLDLDLTAAPGDVHYARIRLYAPGDTEGERMWISPWYFD